MPRRWRRSGQADKARAAAARGMDDGRAVARRRGAADGARSAASSPRPSRIRGWRCCCGRAPPLGATRSCPGERAAAADLCGAAGFPDQGARRGGAGGGGGPDAEHDAGYHRRPRLLAAGDRARGWMRAPIWRSRETLDAPAFDPTRLSDGVADLRERGRARQAMERWPTASPPIWTMPSRRARISARAI